MVGVGTVARGGPKEAKAETTWKDGTRGEWHGVDHTLDEQFHGYRVKGSLPWLTREFGGRRCDVSFFFSFFSNPSGYGYFSFPSFLV